VAVRRVIVACVAVLTVAVVTLPTSASAARFHPYRPPGKPTIVFNPPGTSAQISALISSSTSITSLPTDLDPPLYAVAGDDINNLEFHTSGGGCSVTSAACTYGDVTSTKLVVLFGDSHAWMWLPAVNPVMVQLGYRLQLLWRPGCPASDFDFAPSSCVTWRTNILKVIQKEHPALVLVAERTTHVFSIGTTLVTANQWVAGLEKTIRLLQSATTRVVVIGDTPAFANAALPAACLSVHPTNVQLCSTPLMNKDPSWLAHSGAEKTAVIATRAGYINPVQWLCDAKTCSPIVGNMVVYWDWSHLTATYSSYLSHVMGTRIKTYL
jgi:hypothetical protein